MASGEEGSPCLGPGAAQRKLLSQELFTKQMGEGKEGQGTEQIRAWCICVSVCRCGCMGVPGKCEGSKNEITVWWWWKVCAREMYRSGEDVADSFMAFSSY